MQLIKKVYQKAGISNITDAAFFECHSTRTVIGDTAELSVVAGILRDEVLILARFVTSPA
jgi:acyl transferase domain-containing protein